MQLVMVQSTREAEHEVSSRKAPPVGALQLLRVHPTRDAVHAGLRSEKAPAQ